MTQDRKSKVFCIGFQKTGTSSMRDALTQLGYKVAGHYGTDLPIDELRERYVAIGLEIARDYDAVQDMPWPLIYRELDAAYPGSKFIYTERDADTWIVSMTKHFGTRESSVRQLAYGDAYPYPAGNEAHYKQIYLDHRAQVMEYFKDRSEDFLAIDLEKGEGWPELGRFLDLADVPSGPFVHSNPAEMRDTLSYRFKTLRTKVTRRISRLAGLQP
jgi:hypothetical protein